MARSFTASSSQYIDCGDIDTMDGVAALTLSCWMKRGSADDIVGVTKAADNDNQLYILFYSDGILYTLVRNNSNNYWTYTLNDTDWHHIVMVYDYSQGVNEDKQKQYIDGAFVAGSHTNALNIPATTDDGSADFCIGRWLTNYTDGNIAEVKVWSSALTAGEIKSDYIGQTPRPGNLIGYWRCGVGSPEPDWSGAGNEGTVTNAPTIADHPPVTNPFAQDLAYVPYSEAAPVATGHGQLLSDRRNQLVY